jgi:hypothetical protein
MRALRLQPQRRRVACRRRVAVDAGDDLANQVCAADRRAHAPLPSASDSRCMTRLAIMHRGHGNAAAILSMKARIAENVRVV